MRAVLIIVLLSLVTIASSLECYECTACEEGKLGELNNCTALEDTCQSSTTAGVVTIRKCATKAGCKATCDSTKIIGSDCRCCDTDGCNGGVSARISTLAILVPIAAALKFFF